MRLRWSQDNDRSRFMREAIKFTVPLTLLEEGQNAINGSFSNIAI